MTVQSTEAGDVEDLICARCRLRIQLGHEGGGWATSGPGHLVHADIRECGPPVPPEPLPPVRLSGGRGPWPSDHDLRQLIDSDGSAR